MKKEIKLGHALFVVLFLLFTMVVSCVVFKASPHIPLFFSCIVTCVSAKFHGYTWAETLESMVSGVGQAMEAIIILMLVGILMAVWIASGTVPAMMYYGLKLMNARYFFVITFILCAAASMALGSWGTAGTIGLAILGIGTALGLPPAATAGAIVSGAYVGDKASPLTDCLNLTANVSKCDMHKILRRLLPVIWKVLLLTAVLFLLLGLHYNIRETPEMLEKRQNLLHALDGAFCIDLVQLLPLAIVIGCSILGVPAIPALTAGIAAGMLQACVFQHCTVIRLFEYSYSGFVGQTGFADIDRILSNGGIGSMMYTVSLAMIALAFGGVITKTKHMDALVTPALLRIRTPFGMIVFTIILGIVINMILPDQYLCIALCGQLFADKYSSKKVDAALFANAVSAAAITSALIPWNSCGVYMTSILGVGPAEYLRFSWFNLLMPAGMILHSAFLTFFRRKKNAQKTRFKAPPPPEFP